MRFNISEKIGLLNLLQIIYYKLLPTNYYHCRRISPLHVIENVLNKRYTNFSPLGSFVTFIHNGHIEVRNLEDLL